MDPLSHCLVGAVCAKTIGASRRRFWAMAILGGLPDIDVLGGSLGLSAEILQHRSATHSLVGAVALSLLFSWGLRRWDKGPSQTRFFQYLLPVVLHLFCDLLTSFGIPLLMPFNDRMFSLDLVGSVNLFPIVVMGAVLFWSFYRESVGWRATRWAWVTWALYLALMFTGKVYAGRIVGSCGSEMTALPTHYNPFHWRAVAVDNTRHAYCCYDVNLLMGRSIPKGLLATPNGDLPVRASLQSKLVQNFLERNRWPVVRITKETNGFQVEWGTLMFSSLGAVRGKVIVVLGSDGKILQERRVVDFWTPENIG